MVTAARKTSIATPRTLDLKQVQTLADSVKARIAEMESETLLLAQRATGTGTTAASIDALQSQLSMLAIRLTALTAAVAALTGGAGAASAQPTYIMIEVDGAEGEPGLTIPGPTGPKGEPGPALFIPGEDGEDGAFYPPP